MIYGQNDQTQVTDDLSQRYQCLICPNYNLCSSCFENRKFNQIHQVNHPMVRYDQPDILFGQKAPPSNEVTIAHFRRLFKDQEHPGVFCDV